MAEKSSGTDTVVKVVLVFFISLLSFSIGTFVGKKFSDNQHRMATMEPNKAHKEDGAEQEEQDPHATAKKNSEHGEKNHEKEALNEEQASALEGEMTEEESLSSNAPTNTPPSHAKADKEEKAEKTESSPSTPKLTKVLAKEMAAKGTGQFTIQIASYSTQEEAEKRVNELKAQKFESFSTETTIKGHQWYRVNVGVFATIKEAQAQKAVLADRAKISNVIIQKLNK